MNPEQPTVNDQGLPRLATVKNTAKAFCNAGETENAIRANVFKAEDRINSRGEKIPGNGLAASGAIIRRGGKILIDLDRYGAWLAGRAGPSRMNAAKPTYPPADTRLRQFLDAMLDGRMHEHPHYIQAVGHFNLAAMADDLRDFGWQVRMVELHAPTVEAPQRMVALYYIGQHNLDAAMGDSA